MACEDLDHEVERQLDELLAAMEPAGDTPPEPWDVRITGARLSEQIAAGASSLLVKEDLYWGRPRRMHPLRRRVEQLGPAAYARHQAVHDALAWALDAEVLAGSFDQADPHIPTPPPIDRIADRLLVWLKARGMAIVPCTPFLPVTPPAGRTPPLVLWLDLWSGMVLDEPTHDLYVRIHDNDVAFEDVERDEEDDEDEEDELTALNTTAAAWCQALALSPSLPEEPAPPSGSVGQYGRHGCVLRETAASETVVLHDVCLVAYETDRAVEFVAELVATGTVGFLPAAMRDREVVACISGLHTVSRYLHREELDADIAQVPRRTDVAAALDWGRRHAECLAHRSADDRTERSRSW